MHRLFETRALRHVYASALRFLFRFLPGASLPEPTVRVLYPPLFSPYYHAILLRLDLMDFLGMVPAALAVITAWCAGPGPGLAH